MNQVNLNGADAQEVADLIGGVLILVNTTDDIASIAGGDLTKLELSNG